jgi:hypothetical protein
MTPPANNEAIPERLTDPTLAPPTPDPPVATIENLTSRVEALEGLLAKVFAQQTGPAIQKQIENQIRQKLAAGEPLS